METQKHLFQEIKKRARISEPVVHRPDTKKRAQLRKKMDDLLPLRMSGDIDQDHFAEIYQPLVTQVKQLDKSTPELQTQIDLERIQLTSSDYVLNEAKILYKEWSKMLFPQKRAIVETINNHITVEQNVIDIALSHLPSSSKQTSPHNFIHALPCLRFEQQISKPLPKSTPINPKTLGKHIRKRRMELRLFQKDAAAILMLAKNASPIGSTIEVNLKFNTIHLSSGF